MRTAARALFSCVLIATSSFAAACATSTNNGPGDDAGGGTVVSFGKSEAGDTGSMPVIIGSGDDAGLPTITVTNDGGGGGDSVPDATSTETPDTGTPDVFVGTPDVFVLPDAPMTTQEASTPPPAGDAGTCGFSTGVAACDACLTSSCCSSEQTCAGSSACTTCITAATPAASCNSNADYTKFLTCADNDCSTACGGSADGGTDSGGATGGGTPTTCAEADTTVGCCGANGDNYYCGTNSTSVTKTACTGGQVCGWSASNKYYECVAGPAEADPSGKYPIACK